MANGNQGIGGFLPFPTFGGEKSGGITPVQMSPMSPNFPTPRAINRRTPEPEFKEKIGGLAPLALQGIGQLFGGDDTPRTPDEYAMDELGLTEQQLKDEDLTKLQRAQLEAYSVYGEAAPKDDFGWDEIANIAAASMMGRGADDYATTYLALKKAAKAKEATKEISRADFIKSKTDANIKNDTYIDFIALTNGAWDPRDARQDPDTGRTTVVSDDKSRYTDILDPSFKDRNYVSLEALLANGVNPAIYLDENITALAKLETDVLKKDRSALQFINVVGDVVPLLQDEDSTVSTVAKVENFTNSLLTNWDQALDKVGFLGFATEDDVRNGTAGSAGRTGTGRLSQRLSKALQSGTTEQIHAAMDEFGKEHDINFREVLGDRAYKNVRTEGLLLQMAYLAAAANGQTGRTLSDKDLAYHLRMVGFGASDDAAVVLRVVKSFTNSIIDDTDAWARSSLTLNTLSAGRYGTLDEIQNNERLQGFINVNYDVKDKDYKNLDNYTYKTFEQRHNLDPGVRYWFDSGFYDGSVVDEDQRKKAKKNNLKSIFDFKINERREKELTETN